MRWLCYVKSDEKDSPKNIIQTTNKTNSQIDITEEKESGGEQIR